MAVDLKLRRTLEIAFVDEGIKTRSGREKSEADWFNNVEFSNLILVWKKLVEYYQYYEDTVISIDVLRTYFIFGNILGGVEKNQFDVQTRQKIESTLKELENGFEEIMDEGMIAINSPI